MNLDKAKLSRIAPWILAIVLLALPLMQMLKNREARRAPELPATLSGDPDAKRLLQLYEALDVPARKMLLSVADTLAGNSSNAAATRPVVSWEMASEYVGQTVTVVGRIAASYNSGRACFLNFHEDYRRSFTAVIFKSAFAKFPANPEDYYLGKLVSVTGKVKEYQGRPEIILEEPAQITVSD